jgi:type IV secretion system protein VirB3
MLEGEGQESMVDPLFAGKTRPPMYAGVTLSFFAFNLIVMTVFLLGSGSLIPLLIGFPLVHVIGYLFCLKDPRIFDILWAKGRKTSRCVNRKLWGGNSYDVGR